MLKVEDVRDKLIYAKTDIIPALNRAGQIELANKIDGCGDVVRLANCCNCGTRHYAGASRCRSRYCPHCAKLRSMLWLAKLLPFFGAWLRNGGYIFKMNFTISDTDKLKDGLELIGGAWRYMTGSNKAMRKDWKTRFAGGVRSLEVKVGKNSGKWHPHFHCLVLKDKYYRDFKPVQANWERSLNVVAKQDGKHGSVWMRGFDKRHADSNELLQAVLETFKYITDLKFRTSTAEQVAELLGGLHSKKCIQTWGVLYAMADEVEAEMESKSIDEIRDHVCAVCGFTEFEYENILRAEFLEDSSIKDLKRNG